MLFTLRMNRQHFDSTVCEDACTVQKQANHLEVMHMNSIHVSVTHSSSLFYIHVHVHVYSSQTVYIQCM